MARSVNQKKLFIRLALIALLVLICLALFYFGREHDVLIDNRTVTIGGVEYKEIEYINVVVDGDEEKSGEYYAGDRDMIKLKGPSHKIKVIVMDEDSEKVIKTVERSLNIGTARGVMYSLPAIVAEASEITLPMPKEEAPEPDSSEESDAAGSEETQPGSEEQQTPISE